MEACHCHLCPHLLLHQLGLRCLNHTLLPSEADEWAFNPTCESHGLGASSHAELPSLFWFAWRTLTSRETLPLLVDSWLREVLPMLAQPSWCESWPSPVPSRSLAKAATPFSELPRQLFPGTHLPGHGPLSTHNSLPSRPNNVPTSLGVAPNSQHQSLPTVTHLPGLLCLFTA